MPTKAGKPRKRKPRDAPTVPYRSRAGLPLTPGQAPPWLDPQIAAVLPVEQGGRQCPPGHWSERVRDTLIGVIATQGSVTTACGLAGISEVTFNQWLARGREDQRLWETAPMEGRERHEPTEWHQFARAVTWAAAVWAGGHAAELQRTAQAEGTPLALAVAIRQWLLTHVGPRTPDRLDVTITHRQVVDEQAEDVDQMLADLVAKREARRRGQEQG